MSLVRDSNLPCRDPIIDLAAIRHGLAQGEFFLEYLPTISLTDGRCIGAEALIRWRRASGVVPPGAFIPLAENTPLKWSSSMTRRKRRNHSPTFKAQVAVAALKGDKTLAELAQQCRILRLPRSSAYYTPREVSPQDLMLMRRMRLEALYRNTTVNLTTERGALFEHAVPRGCWLRHVSRTCLPSG